MSLSMRRTLTRAGAATAAALVLFAPCSASAQDWKGMGRLEGRVLGPDGKPVPDVNVKLALGARAQGPALKTDKKGRWAVGGIAAGHWNLDIDSPGFVPKKLAVDLPSKAARL